MTATTRPSGPHFTYTDDEGNETYETIGARKHAVQHVEMTVRRAILFFDLFEKWTKRFKDSGWQGTQDWRNIDPAEYRKILDSGDNKWYDVQPLLEIEELWIRYKNGRLAREILELAENLVLEDLSKKSRKEITNGLNRVRKATDR